MHYHYKLKYIYGITNTIWMSKTKSTYSIAPWSNYMLGICGNYLYVFFWWLKTTNIKSLQVLAVICD